MRTSVILETDVDRLLRQAIKERGVSFKRALNDAVMAGLAPRTKPFVQKTYSLGLAQNFNWDKALAIAAELEDQEIIRKMHARR